MSGQRSDNRKQAQQPHKIKHKRLRRFLESDIGKRMLWRPSGKKPINVKKPGRNDPCPCLSGKKYKNCCGR